MRIPENGDYVQEQRCFFQGLLHAFQQYQGGNILSETKQYFSIRSICCAKLLIAQV